MWTWHSTLSKIKINTVGRLYFVCTCLYRSLFRWYLEQLNKKWKIKNGQRATLRFFNFIYAIRKRIVCTCLYLSYFRLYLKEFGAFQVLRDPYIANLANFQDIEMVRNGTNGIRKRTVCTRLYLSYFRLYFKGFEDTAISKFRNSRGEIGYFWRCRNETNGKRRSTNGYKRISFRYLENWLNSLYRDCVKIETRCISESFEVQTKVGKVQTDINDSLSNGINEIKKS